MELVAAIHRDLNTDTVERIGGLLADNVLFALMALYLLVVWPALRRAGCDNLHCATHNICWVPADVGIADILAWLPRAASVPQ